MKLQRFAIVQTQDIGYLRQVECEFVPEFPASVERLRDHITFRVSIEFEEESTLVDCLRAGLLEVRRIVGSQLEEPMASEGRQ
jgi:hypothetical protein